MAWAGLIKTRTKHLTIRIEDTQEPCWLARLYDGDAIVGEESADSPKLAIAKAVKLARSYLHDESITAESLDWAQV